jgi:hypothetical protein
MAAAGWEAAGLAEEKDWVVEDSEVSVVKDSVAAREALEMAVVAVAVDSVEALEAADLAAAAVAMG